MNHGAWLLFSARVLMSTVRASAGIVVPVYLAQLGHGALWLGVVFLLVGLVSAGLSVTIGLWSDRVGRKPFLIWLPVVTGAAAAGYALTADPVVLVAAAAAGSFGRGSGAGSGVVGPYQPAEQALMASLATPQTRTRIFSIFASGSAAGALLGSLLALIPGVPGTATLSGPGPYRIVFWLMAALAVAAGAVVVAVREPEQRAPRRSRRVATPGERAAGQLSERARWLLYRLWGTNSVNGVAVGLFGPFVTYWFHRKFGAGTSEIGALFAVINIVTVATNLSAGRLARRLGTVRAIVAARLLQGLLLIPMAFMPTFWAAGAIYLVRMSSQRIGLPLRQSYVMGLAQANERARVAALSRLPSQLITATAPTLSGYLLQEVSLSLPFALAGVLQMVTASLFYAFFRKTPPDD